MTVAKKIRPKRCKIQNGTFLKMTVAKKCCFLAAVFFIRYFLSLALFDFGFFWPQSFLKTVTKKERSKQLRQTKEKIQLHSWWITMTMAT